MSFSTNINFEARRILPFGSIGATYVPIGTPSENDAKFLGALNITDVPLFFSLNGVDDQFVFFPGTGAPFFVIELSGNGEDVSFPKGTQLFVKQVAGPPTVGEVNSLVGFTE